MKEPTVEELAVLTSAFTALYGQSVEQVETELSWAEANSDSDPQMPRVIAALRLVRDRLQPEDPAEASAH